MTRKVLVVEDDLLNRMFYVDALAASGKSGHHYLTCGVTDEITVMVSHNEYPEDLRP